MTQKRWVVDVPVLSCCFNIQALGFGAGGFASAVRIVRPCACGDRAKAVILFATI
jgi:hypothetical protein